MKTPHTLGIILLVSSAASQLVAQPKVSSPEWELLMTKPLPAGSIPNIHVVDLPLPPAPAVPRPPGAGHTHAGPVFGYIVKGTVENLVEPDPPEEFKTGEVFYEPPRHLHRSMRNMSTTDSAQVIAFQTSDEGGGAPQIKVLLHADLVTTLEQQVRLLKLTLPGAVPVQRDRHANTDAVCVLEGNVAISDVPTQKQYGPGECFQRSAIFRNVNSTSPAKLLVYQVIEQSAPLPTH